MRTAEFERSSAGCRRCWFVGASKEALSLGAMPAEGGPRGEDAGTGDDRGELPGRSDGSEVALVGAGGEPDGVEHVAQR